MGLSPQNQGIRERSGSVNDDRPLVAFLYQLIRDHLPAGVIEEIIQKHVFPTSGETESEYCNGYIARYAQDIADRLAIDVLPPEVLTHERFNEAQATLQAMYPRIAAAIGPGLRRSLAALGYNADGVYCCWDSSTNSMSLTDTGGAWVGFILVPLPGKASIPDIKELMFQAARKAFQSAAKDLGATPKGGVTQGGPVPAANEVIPVTDYCPEPLLSLRGAINSHEGLVHAIVVRPEFFHNFLHATDAAFDRETELRLLGLGVAGYWHTIPVMQNRDTTTDWVIL